MRTLPVITLKENGLAYGYHNAIKTLFFLGIKIKTQYDKPEDPSSLDATANITYMNPMADPMIHKAFPGGIEDLAEYFLELMGAKDSWVRNMDDPDDKRWEYTYHQRLSKWGSWKESNSVVGKSINQIEQVIDKLSKQPFSRQAQMITWIPFMDYDVYDPPCLQSLHFRLLDDVDKYYLATNIRFRSNDAWNAHFMNLFGLTLFVNEAVAKPLSEKLGKQVLLDRINWQADSFHIYGKDIQVVNKMLINSDRQITDMVMNFYDDEIQEIWKEGLENAKIKIAEYNRR